MGRHEGSPGRRGAVASQGTREAGRRHLVREEGRGTGRGVEGTACLREEGSGACCWSREGRASVARHGRLEELEGAHVRILALGLIGTMGRVRTRNAMWHLTWRSTRHAGERRRGT